MGRVKESFDETSQDEYELEKKKKRKKKKDKEEKKKIKKPIRILRNIFSISNILAMAFLVYSIYLINGIETEIRFVVMGVILIINLLFVILLRKLVNKNKLIKFLIFVILSSILIFGQCILGYFIFKTYSTLNNINKNKITFETAVVIKKDANILTIEGLKNKKIGIVVDESSIDGYVIGLEIIKDKKLDDKNVIVEYESITELMKDLYKKEIDAIIISSNYPSMFKSLEGYEKIQEETKIIHTKEKTLTKSEIAKYTGEETVNFNTSDSVTEPFTVLLMGVDSTKEKLDKNASGNGDSLMLLTFNPKTLNATIFSIPRDTYVSIPCSGFNGIENKITHAAWQGESCMIKTIEKFTGIDIDYYVKINFKGVVKLVDAMGGVEIDVPEILDGVCEQNSDRKFGSNVICFKKGKQTLNGEAALALARHRKTLATGDFQRGVHQQLVVQGMLNKLKSVRSANQAMDILDAVSNSMDTNFTTKQILSFYDIAKNIILTSNSDNLINLQQLYLTGSGQMIYDERSGLVLYEFIPNKSSLNQIVDAMESNLSANTKTKSKTMNFNIEEKFEMTVIGENPTSGTTTYTLLPSFVGKTASYAEDWLKDNGISVKIEEKEITDGSYKDGYVIEQSAPAKSRVDKISSVTLTVAKVTEDEPIIDEIIGDETLNDDITEDDNSSDNTDVEDVTDNTDNTTDNNNSSDNTSTDNISNSENANIDESSSN